MTARPTAPDVPVIDLAGLTASSLPAASIVDRVVAAAEQFGFFQIVNHGIPAPVIERVQDRSAAFFAGPMEEKRRLLRTKDNTRGYYDRELTKNARDLKEVLDLAHVPYPDLADDDPRNHHAVDGVNRWPDIDGFRPAVLDHLAACESLSLRLLSVFAVGLGERPDRLAPHFGPDHTSFVRLNHYPVADPLTAAESAGTTPLGDMALHYHSDAGALTLLLQDDVGGLQVEHRDRWLDVRPVPGALVVNTGDMMQVWSNDRFPAAVHQVVPVTDRPRMSLPYFFNPSYDTDYAPLPGSIGPGAAHYRSINWGAFRQARADGDFADYGAEVQIADYRI